MSDVVTPGSARDAGLTLLEMLIVLAVIAVAAGATVLSLAPRRGTATEAEATRLATAIQTAADRSLITGSPEMLVVDETGYVTGGIRHAMPAGTTLVSAAGNIALGLDTARPVDLVVATGRERWVVSFDGLRAVAAATRDAA